MAGELVNSSDPDTSRDASGQTAGRTFGRYQVIHEIGAGAMGAVYLARDDKLGREVAVKALRLEDLPEYAAEMSLARFDNEARAIAALRHAHIVQVFDVGVQDDTPYIVMEVAHGASLKDRIRNDGPLPVALVATIGCHMAQALEAAHQSAIIHRDVKPANILEVEPGLFKLADFGIARIPESTLTLPGQFIGTPSYASPEAIQIGQVTPEIDIYSLGATLYEACIGAPPYGDGGLMTPGALDDERPPEPMRVRRPDLPPAVEDIILRAVAREPAARPSAAEMVAVLVGYQISGQAPVQTLNGGYAGVPTGPNATVNATVVPGTGRASLSQGQKIALAVGLLIALIIGVALGASDEDEDEGVRPSPSLWQPSARPTAPAAFAPDYTREPHYRREWNKILDKIDEGKYRDAEKRARKLLRKYPDDPGARDLVEQLQQYRE